MGIKEKTIKLLRGGMLEPLIHELNHHYHEYKEIQHNKRNETLTAQWIKVIENSSDNVKFEAPNEFRILFATMYGFGGSSPAGRVFETIIAKSLQLRGSHVSALVCNAALPACTWNRYGNHQLPVDEFGPKMYKKTQMNRCNKCRNELHGLFPPIGIEQVQLSELMKYNDLEHATTIVNNLKYDEYDDFKYKEVNIGEHARSTVLRVLLRGTLEEDDLTKWTYRRYMISAIMLTDLLERVFEIDKPTHVVAVHGIYLEHGVICDLARSHGIAVIVHGIPYRKGTVWLSHDDTYHRTLISEPVSEWDFLEMTDEQNKMLDSYLGSKLSGGKENVNFHPSPVFDKETLYKELALDPNKPIIGMFTNVLWDAQIVYGSNAFEDMLDWIYQTIDYYEKRTDLQLVIRIHPAEAKGGFSTAQPIVGEIQKKYPTLPSNVKVIAPESHLSSYTLADVSKATIIYGTKMGLEIAIKGIPVIVAGEAFCAKKGFTHDVATKEQYFDLMDNILDIPRNHPKMINKARTFAYHLFFRRMIDFSLFEYDPILTLDTKLKVNNLEDLLPGKSKALDVICDGILKRKHFVQ